MIPLSLKLCFRNQIKLPSIKGNSPSDFNESEGNKFQREVVSKVKAYLIFTIKSNQTKESFR